MISKKARLMEYSSVLIFTLTNTLAHLALHVSYRHNHTIQRLWRGVLK